MDWLSIAGLVVGVAGAGWAIYTDWNAAKERGRLYSFLNGLRVAAFADPVPRGALLGAVNEEMARLDPRAFAVAEGKRVSALKSVLAGTSNTPSC